MQEYNSRKEVPEKYKWDLTDFFKDENEFNKSFETTKKLISELKQYNGCTSNPDKLYDFLNKWIEAVALWEDLYAYSFLVNDQELGNSLSIARKNKTQILYAELEKNTSFFAPELLKLEEKEYDELFESEKLQEFKADLDKTYREKAHILTENEEKIISELVNAADNFDDMSSTMINSEHDYGKVKIDNKTITIATTNYRNLLKNKDEKIRKKVYTSFNKKLEQYGASSASFLNSYVSVRNTLAKIRHYENSWSENLETLNISDKVFKTLVSTVENNLDSLHKYYELKRNILGLDVLHPYDLSLNLEENQINYRIEDAEEIVKKATSPLGPVYAKKLNKIFDRHYIDYCQYKGKCSGGYSLSTILQDSRILMSFNEDLESISTIAHEAGHNVHHQFIKENNPLQYRNASSIVAEVCSLTNECLLSDYMYENGKTKEEKLSGLSSIMGVIVSNLFGAVREGKIEQDMYDEVFKGGTITKDFMNKKTKQSLKKYYGPQIKLDKFANNSWITRSHYYMNFYLYSYAICISVAINVASEIQNGNKNMLDNYIKFMKVGSDKWPIEAFEVLGVDLEDKKLYENAINYFDNLVEKYEELYKEEVK